jgi:Holliday junction resolvase RusA-like endonuclease
VGLDPKQFSHLAPPDGRVANQAHLPIRFFVPGEPAPGGSKKAFRSASTGQIVVMDDAVRNAPWRSAVSLFAAQAYRGVPFDCPLSVTMTFFMTRPKSHYRTGKHAGELKPDAPTHHRSKPDCLKCARSAEDALTGVIWKDDSANVRLVLEKLYGDRPGVTIVIDAINPEDYVQYRSRTTEEIPWKVAAAVPRNTYH